MNSFLVPNFLGSKNAGKKSGQVAMNWQLVPQGQTSQPATSFASAIPGNLLLPGQNAPLLWYPYSVDPLSNQGSYSFGEGRSFQLSLTRRKGWVVTDTDAYIPGRVLVYVESTGQQFILGPKEFLTTPPEGNIYFPTESDNLVADIFLAGSGKIQVWLEQDIGITTGAETPTAPSALVQITVMNFNIAPVALG